MPSRRGPAIKNLMKLDFFPVRRFPGFIALHPNLVAEMSQEGQKRPRPL
jgi:hypothetical protein